MHDSMNLPNGCAFASERFDIEIILSEVRVLVHIVLREFEQIKSDTIYGMCRVYYLLMHIVRVNGKYRFGRMD